MGKKKLDKGHNGGFNRDDNNWGRNREAEVPEGEPVADPEEMPREEYDGNLDPIPDDRINID